MEIKNIASAALNLERVFNRVGSGNKAGLTLRMQVLTVAYKNGGEASVKQIFDNVKIVKSNLAILTKKLVEAGELTKNKNPKNNRAVVYVLTEKGKAEVETFLSEAEKAFAKILSEREQAELNSACEKINKILD